MQWFSWLCDFFAKLVGKMIGFPRFRKKFKKMEQEWLIHGYSFPLAPNFLKHKFFFCMEEMWRIAHFAGFF